MPISIKHIVNHPTCSNATITYTYTCYIRIHVNQQLTCNNTTTESSVGIQDCSYCQYNAAVMNIVLQTTNHSWLSFYNVLHFLLHFAVLHIALSITSLSSLFLLLFTAHPPHIPLSIYPTLLTSQLTHCVPHFTTYSTVQ